MKMMKNIMALAFALTLVFVGTNEASAFPGYGGEDTSKMPVPADHMEMDCGECHADTNKGDDIYGFGGEPTSTCSPCHSTPSDGGTSDKDDIPESPNTKHQGHTDEQCFTCHEAAAEPQDHSGSLECSLCHGTTATGDSNATDARTTDTDGDSLMDYDEEFVYGTSYTKTDTDGDGVQDGDEVNVGTNPDNNVPTLGGDTSVSTSEETSVSGSVLATDVDKRDTLTYTAVSADNGTVVIDPATGDFTYTPNTNFYGVDTFTYEVSDGKETSVGTVEVTVTGTDDAIIAPEEGASAVVADGVLKGDLTSLVTEVDGDTLTFILTGQAANGVVVLNADGTFTYTPNAGFTGTDSFTYSVTDGTTTVEGTFTINVTESVTAPPGGETPPPNEMESPVTKEVSTNPITGGTAGLALSLVATTVSGAGMLVFRKRK